MPTADEYEGFASAFERLRSGVAETSTQVGQLGCREGLGGSFGNLVDRAYIELIAQFNHVGEDLRLAAAECRRRATVCDDYAAELRRYETELDDWRIERASFEPVYPYALAPPPMPRRPEAPYDWVDAP